MLDYTTIQFDMSNDKLRSLDSLADSLNITRRDLFNNAFSILKWTIEESKKGRSIASVDEAEKIITTLNLPILERTANERK